MALGWRGQYFRYKDFYLDMLALYKKRKDLQVYIELILSLSTIVIFIVFALKPTALTIISLYNDVKAKKTVLASLNQKIKDLQTANNIYSQNQQFIPDVNAAVFSYPQPDTVSKQIFGLGVKDSINVIGVSIGQVVLVGQTKLPITSIDTTPLPGKALSMPLSVSIEGTYPNILLFAKDYENLRVPSKIDSLTISSSQTQGGSVIVGVITSRIPYLGTQ